jgi:hypothetical protein
VKIGLYHQNAAFPSFRQGGGEIHDYGRFSIVSQRTGDQKLLQFSRGPESFQLHPEEAEPVGRGAAGIGMKDKPVFSANISLLNGKLGESGSRGGDIGGRNEAFRNRCHGSRLRNMFGPRRLMKKVAEVTHLFAWTC